MNFDTIIRKYRTLSSFNILLLVKSTYRSVFFILFPLCVCADKISEFVKFEYFNLLLLVGGTYRSVFYPRCFHCVYVLRGVARYE